MPEMLREMLSYCRPSGSATEEQFVKRFIDVHDPLIDEYGNRTLIVGPRDPRIMFASHFDTVHRRGGRQKVRVNNKGQLIATSKHSNCLGADDTTGVYIMLRLIEAEIPGAYIFHFGEEIGCVGAQGIAGYDPFDILPGIEMSLEFDRRGYHSMVTHQMGSRCASDDFAHALCDALDMGHKPDDSGIWTDNVEYKTDIPEIVNISVGYFNQHSTTETQCPVYVEDLIASLKEVDFDTLPIERDPTAVDPGENYSFRGYGRSRASEDFQDLYDTVCENPDYTAEMLWEYGFEADDIRKHSRKARVRTFPSVEDEDMTDEDISRAIAEEMSDEAWWNSRFDKEGYAG